MEKKDDTQKENPVTSPKPPRLGQRPTPIGVGATPLEGSPRRSPSPQSPRRKEPSASTAGPSKSSKIEPRPLSLISEEEEDEPSSSPSPERKEPPASIAGSSTPSKNKPRPLSLIREESEDEPRLSQSPKRKGPPASTAVPSTPSKLIKLDKLRLISEDAGDEPSDDPAISNMEVAPPRQPEDQEMQETSSSPTHGQQEKPSTPEKSQSLPQRDQKGSQG